MKLSDLDPTEVLRELDERDYLIDKLARDKKGVGDDDFSTVTMAEHHQQNGRVNLSLGNITKAQRDVIKVDGELIVGDGERRQAQRIGEDVDSIFAEAKTS